MTEQQQEAIRRLVGHVIIYRSTQVQRETLTLLESMAAEIATIIGAPVSEVELFVCDAALKAARGDT